MPFTGTLRTWHDDKGFGFIAPTHGGPEVFVHIRDLPRDGSRPVVGETLRYELGRGDDGRPRAVGVVRLAIGTPPPPRPRARRGDGSPRWLSVLGMLALVLVLSIVGRWGYKSYEAHRHRSELRALPAEATPVEPLAPAATRRCDGRTHCSQMSSCAEATWFINNCPGMKMDGDGDGTPCEEQLCRHPLAP